MTREQKYAEQMKALGIYQEIYEPEIRMLAGMERELQRLTKRWRDDGSHIGGKSYEAILTLRRDILSHRDALGLTPKGYNRIKPKDTAPPLPAGTGATVLELIQKKRREA